MARYSGGTRATGAGSTTLPMGALAASANVDVTIFEVGVFNTTTTAVSMSLRRITTAGTPGTGLSELPHEADKGAATATLLDTYTSTGPTITAGAFRIASLGAAIGSGVIWTFSGMGLRIPKGTANAIVLIPWTGTGQICDWYVEWEE